MKNHLKKGLLYFVIIKGILHIAIPLTIANNIFFNLPRSVSKDIILFNLLSLINFSIFGIVFAFFKYKKKNTL
ncbi:hypothetical protein EDC19_2399 [Natranaerovirga hydrolytica]|uniref:Uncharacterized protein n=1 Tax=Natranaerovirga hydrolytica TaxID=680378 RepID=A0A4R1MFV8_9FIRM|nr:hypothetical protein [Natranaerovirga hydrolytica]TCK90630.1 hypothetical protein EDC19_2399 [Natranaerovirga hydrolytica]